MTAPRTSKRRRPEAALLTALGALVAIALCLPAAAGAHAPDVGLSGFGTPDVDGVLTPGEWASATRVDFTVGAPVEDATGFPLPTFPVPASIWAMNDSSNLYLAVRVERPYLGTTSISAEFDNDHNGVIFEEGDDVFVFNAPGSFFDAHRTLRPPCPPGGVCGLLDTQGGGTNDGRGAAQNDGFHTVWELEKPLDSADNAHDFSLRAGSTVGFQLFLRLFNRRGACCADTHFPRPFGDIRIQPFDVTLPETVITGGPAGGSATNQTTAVFRFAGTDDTTPADELEFRCDLDGAPAGCTSPLEHEGLAAGMHVFSVAAIDAAGNADPTPATVSWTVDLTPPSLSVVGSRDELWPPDHRLVPVTFSVGAEDSSGIQRLVLLSATSNEADDGNGDGDLPGDIQGAEVETLDTEVELRAERFGFGFGRVYEVTYAATDMAGNTATASAVILAPHDPGR